MPLSTVFDKGRRYRVTVSGVVELTVSSVTLTIDPLFSYSGNCQSPSARTGVRLIDSRGIDVFSPFSAVPAPRCRSDHTYTFTLNGPKPFTGVLAGRIKARNDITLTTARGDTATGSFTIEPEPDEPAVVVRFGVDANEKRNVVATSFNGRGVMEAAAIREGALADRARLLPVPTLSGEAPELAYVREGLRARRIVVEVTSGELVMQGARGTAEERFSLRLIVEVVASTVPGCPAASKVRRGARGTVVLVDYPRGSRDSFVNAFLDLPCGVDETWASTESDVSIRVSRPSKKP